MDVDYVFFIQNINNCHWVTAVADLHNWIILIYDNDHSVTAEAKLLELMLPLRKAIPDLMIASKQFEHFAEIQGKRKVKMFKCKRLSRDHVPQSKKQRYVG